MRKPLRIAMLLALISGAAAACFSQSIPNLQTPGTPKNAHLSMVYPGFRYVLPSTAGTLLRVPRPD
jgi:hypothetical protein